MWIKKQALFSLSLITSFPSCFFISFNCSILNLEKQKCSDAWIQGMPRSKSPMNEDFSHGKPSKIHILLLRTAKFNHEKNYSEFSTAQIQFNICYAQLINYFLNFYIIVVTPLEIIHKSPLLKCCYQFYNYAAIVLRLSTDCSVVNFYWVECLVSS